MRVDFHTHTIFSDGSLLPAALVYEAALRGNNAIAITDHVDFSNLEATLSAIIKFIKDQAASLPIKVLPGVEISYVAPALVKQLAQKARQLGAKIIVVHGESVAEPAVPKGTNHAALQLKGLVDILAHPGKISEEDTILAKINNIYLELSARPSHKKGNKHVAMMARQFGAALLVNTDSHCEHDLINRAQALKIARAAGLSQAEALLAVETNPAALLKLRS